MARVIRKAAIKFEKKPVIVLAKIDLTEAGLNTSLLKVTKLNRAENNTTLVPNNLTLLLIFIADMKFP